MACMQLTDCVQESRCTKVDVEVVQVIINLSGRRRGMPEERRDLHDGPTRVTLRPTCDVSSAL